MEHRNLVSAGVTISPICLGTGFRARPDDATCRATIERTIAWVLSHPEISAVIIGPDHPEQVKENVGGTGWQLAAEERSVLDELSAWAVGGGIGRR